VVEDRPPAPPEDVDAGDAGARGFVADAVRKAVLTGLGAVFLTEEGARKLAREWKLPKEIVGYVTAQAEFRLKPAKAGKLDPDVKISGVKARLRRKDEPHEE
jgi:hypothetical protein